MEAWAGPAAWMLARRAREAEAEQAARALLARAMVAEAEAAARVALAEGQAPVAWAEAPQVVVARLRRVEARAMQEGHRPRVETLRVGRRQAPARVAPAEASAAQATAVPAQVERVVTAPGSRARPRAARVRSKVADARAPVARCCSRSPSPACSSVADSAELQTQDGNLRVQVTRRLPARRAGRSSVNAEFRNSGSVLG